MFSGKMALAGSYRGKALCLFATDNKKYQPAQVVTNSLGQADIFYDS